MADQPKNYLAKSAPFTVLLNPADVAEATAKAKEQGLSFSADGMVESIRRDECSVHPDESCAAFEWVEISAENQKHALSLLVAGCKVELPKF